MTVLKDRFEGADIRILGIHAKVLEISDIGWVLEIIHDTSCLSDRLSKGDIVFWNHTMVGGARLVRP